MAPKRKGGKSQVDDWEAGLGETPGPIVAVTEEARAGDVTQDGVVNDGIEGSGAAGGGLLAALKKNKAKRAKKGKVIDDLVEGEDPPELGGAVAGDSLQAKAPEEATFDDVEDVGVGAKKGKGGKKHHAEKPAEDEADDDKDDAGGVKSKKEKEKEKKEREKQRKKEQVCFHIPDIVRATF